MSEINPIVEKDYLAEARERYTFQFKNKDVFDRYIQLLLAESGRLQSVFKDILQNRSLDTAKGIYLDRIGDIVGIKRGSLPSSAWENSYFGFSDDPDALQFGDLENGSGGIFFGLADQTEGNVLWNDDIYRIYIKAKIFANTSNGTPEEVITATKSILNVTSVDIIETGNANLLIGFNRILTDVEKFILKGLGEDERILPIPIGVGVGYIESEEEFFGFEETPGALGFASFEEVEGAGYGVGYGQSYGTGNPTIGLIGGGYFASLF